jgi:hypothetical protein
MSTSQRIQVSAIFLWIGFVCAISFMEAWLKFTAPGVTLTIGLAIGQRVFSALNKVEIIFALIVMAILWLQYKPLQWRHLLLLTALSVLAVQSLYLLPELSSRIDLILDGRLPPPSSLHSYYIIAEVVKVLMLTIFGFKQLSHDPNRTNTW